MIISNLEEQAREEFANEYQVPNLLAEKEKTIAFVEQMRTKIMEKVLDEKSPVLERYQITPPEKIMVISPNYARTLAEEDAKKDRIDDRGNLREASYGVTGKAKKGQEVTAYAYKKYDDDKKFLGTAENAAKSFIYWLETGKVLEETVDRLADGEE